MFIQDPIVIMWHNRKRSDSNDTLFSRKSILLVRRIACEFRRALINGTLIIVFIILLRFLLHDVRNFAIYKTLTMGRTG